MKKTLLLTGHATLYELVTKAGERCPTSLLTDDEYARFECKLRSGGYSSDMRIRFIFDKKSCKICGRCDPWFCGFND